MPLFRVDTREFSFSIKRVLVVFLFHILRNFFLKYEITRQALGHRSLHQSINHHVHVRVADAAEFYVESYVQLALDIPLDVDPLELGVPGGPREPECGVLHDCGGGGEVGKY